MASVNATPAAKRKIAIIGGGMGALSAAYYLTDPVHSPGFDVTIYTMGWRLGGKGASGRNQSRHARIEEHGLHIWFGTYHNAIDLMTRCYQELGRLPTQPLARFDDAFKPQRRLVLLEGIDHSFRHWPIDFPDWNDVGIGTLTDVGRLVRRAITWVIGHLEQVPHLARTRIDQAQAPLATAEVPVRQLLGADGVTDLSVGGLLVWLKRTITSLPPGPQGTAELRSLSGPISTVLKYLAGSLFLLLDRDLPDDDIARRIWIIGYLGITFVRGILDDDLIAKGFDAVESIEMRAWLQRHTSFAGWDPDQQRKADATAFWSAPMQAFYDASFSYVDGDARQPNCAASTALRCILRILFDYPKAIIYEMQAGMGDAVFAPLYLVLKKRGVRFEFFHRLTNLMPEPDGTRIKSMTLSRQVRRRPDQPYEPLFQVNDLDCWPSEPFYDQIIDGSALRASGANIEHWDQTKWQDTGGTVTLVDGEDFDHVVLGVSYNVLPSVAAALDVNARWKTMVRGLNSAGTQAAQLWFTATRSQLGMDGTPEIFGSYNEPWSSLVDFSHLLCREAWPVGCTPHYLNYTCGPLGKYEPNDDQAVYDRLKDFLQTAGTLWPKAVGPTGFDYAVLHAPAGTAGEQRLKAQYWRANTDPTELYVIAEADTASARLHPDKTGFTNLSIAGEWTNTGINISSIEATVVSGMRVSRGLAGWPTTIPGESDF
ncbi:MAG: NAD(P)-binding protein [Proteobacteria bacterium]|nr:NAD(P)-binding protein [Pseudomonadota bacterium]